MDNISAVLDSVNSVPLDDSLLIKDMSPTIGGNLTSKLEHFNDASAFVLIPVVVFCAICMVVGVTGSTIVCYICGLKLRKNVTNIFVLALASVDLISCVLCIPLEIMELRLPYMFDFPVLCKLVRMLRSITTITSGMILVAIAIERYNRICKPLNKHINNSQAKRVCLAVVIIGCVCSWPAVFVFGKKSTDLDIIEMGAECSINDNFSATLYPFIFYVFLFLLYFATSVSLCCLYSFIAVTIWKRRKLLTNIRNRSPSIPESVICDTKSMSSADASHAQFVEQLSKNIQKRAVPPLMLTQSTSKLKRKHMYSRKRTTCIMFVMTLTVIASCLPYIIVSIFRSILENMNFENMSDVGNVFFHLALKSYMISSAINPYIYGFSNRLFKEECYRLFKKLYCKKGAKRKQMTSHSAKET